MTNRQQTRQRQRELEKLKANIDKISSAHHRNHKLIVCRALFSGVESNKSKQRRQLECDAITTVVSRGNAEHGFFYFEVIQDLPDVILAYDQEKLFRYVFGIVTPKLTIEGRL